MTPTQDFSCEICGVFKNTYFEELLQATNCFSDLKHCIFHNIIFFFYFMLFHNKSSSFYQNSDNESSSKWILVEILCVIFTLTSSFVSDWKKVQASWSFFQSCKRSKKYGLVQQLIMLMLRDLILQSCNSHSLNGDLIFFISEFFIT